MPQMFKKKIRVFQSVSVTDRTGIGPLEKFDFLGGHCYGASFSLKRNQIKVRILSIRICMDLH
jgi:hypothetical protein